MDAGKVYLVGAGPGDPGLITVKGLQCLELGDVVVYDRLVDRRLLDSARPDAELIDVGKIPGERSIRQEEINTLLVEKAKANKMVVRLKGGDPLVFGRGGEEAEALVNHGIPFEVVPGVTSAIAVPAYAGIPLTHRTVSSYFTVVSGSEDPSKGESSIDWDKLATTGATLVVLMGWESLPRIVETLSQKGRSPSTPVALIRWGTLPQQQTVVGNLGDIMEKAREACLSPPVVAVIGEVVEKRKHLRWYDNRPLFGKRVLVTRSRGQASRLSQRLAGEGALPIEVPTIEIAPLEDYGELDSRLLHLDSYDWVVFTSVNGVEAVFSRLMARRLDARALRGVRVAAIGPATAKALLDRGILADVVPDQYVSEALMESFTEQGVHDTKVLLPCADIGGDVLAEGLASQGSHVDRAPAYRTLIPEGSREKIGQALADGIDIATFTSSSTVRNLVSLLNGDVGRLSCAIIACIGPVTASAAREAGLKVDVMAKEYTIPGLVASLIQHYQKENS